MASKAPDLPRVSLIYDLILMILNTLVELFFRAIEVRGRWKIPRKGGVILVAAPHANQIMRNMNRQVSWLMAEKSFERKFVGEIARKLGTVPVARTMDRAKPGKGSVYLPDPIENPLLLRGIGTDFTGPDFAVGSTIYLPAINGQSERLDIADIRGPEEVILKKAPSSADALYQLTGEHNVFGLESNVDCKKGYPSFAGSRYKVAPHMDQSHVYQAVFDRLNQGGCVGIFPEGGSHDRPDLLPLKAGIAIMALGARANNADVQVIPVGLNYFRAHKFRSRAVIEFGDPVEIPEKLVEMYRKGRRREAIGEVLNDVYKSLISVTLNCADYETLMVIQSARRLYAARNPKISLSQVIEINRRLLKGYNEHQGDPRIMRLFTAIDQYNRRLRQLGIRDHQVETARLSASRVLSTLLYRFGLLVVLSVGTLPGLVLFAPVFVASKIISDKKSKEALAASSVKLRGRDVMATWKLLVALAFAPLLYTVYSLLLAYWTSRNRIQGYIPDDVPIWRIIFLGFIIFPAISFAALRIGEVGMDILKSMRPLILCLVPTSASTLGELQEQREHLSKEVTDLINTFGPSMFPDCMATQAKIAQQLKSQIASMALDPDDSFDHFWIHH
ncbi:hypothetical protein L228DRAFT_253014 [Xylona heveae TC161]|uniref:Phospholipid/glycerol acyltransferase domain-containing protein n=1 Tax=Xylona heveae (strain CBS 132557 / TC161) TaxID=1328760 RepID=A0A165HN00_XYLHT|nr:hypothetical protein L228DRAFT_253014 [Xylona heveae TC161]KZF23755.1 hypothetical protein L228DRAFT_253014 [Xylona heveae TC161]